MSPPGVSEQPKPLGLLRDCPFWPRYWWRVHFLRGRMGTRNEGAGDKAPSYRERSQTTDGRCESGHGKSSGSHHEDSLQLFVHRDRDQEGAVLIGGPSPSGG